MNPLNTIKGTLTAGVVLAIVLTLGLKALTSRGSSPEAAAPAEPAAMAPATADELNAPEQEMSPEDDAPVEGEDVIQE